MFSTVKRRSAQVMTGGLILVCLAACGPADQVTAGSNSAVAGAVSSQNVPISSQDAPVTVPAPPAELAMDVAPEAEYGSPAAVSVTLTAGGQPLSKLAVQVSVGQFSAEVSTDSAGKATVTIAGDDLSPGANTVTAGFTGDETRAAVSMTKTVTVTPAEVTLALVATANPSGTTTATATLAAPTGATGSVTFDVDGTALGQVDVVDGAASVEVPATLGLGDHVVTATFAAEQPEQFGSATASSTLSITKVPTTVSAAAVKDSVRYGDQSAFSVSVLAADGVDLTGAVSITDGTNVVAEGMTDEAGQASLSFLNRANPGQGNYTVTYNGTETVGASSAQFVLTTSQTNVDIAITKPSISPGSDGTLLVSLIGTPDRPTGQVTVTLDGAQVGAGPVDAEGNFSVPLVAVPVGSHDIVVTYAGDIRFEPNTASSTLTVKPPLDNPNPDGAAAIEANNPCPATAAACVDLSSELAWLQSGGEVTYGPVSMTSGRAGHRTGVGTFSVYWLDKYHKSSIFNDAPMPNSVFFDGGIAFHAGSLSVQSHGCIHLSDTASEVFFDNLVLGDQVVVFGTEPY